MNTNIFALKVRFNKCIEKDLIQSSSHSILNEMISVSEVANKHSVHTPTPFFCWGDCGKEGGDFF